jgi:dTDP-4-dehydrorhamnose 3,5-epimerase-like enzyme
MYNDKDLNIDWKLNEDEMVFAEKDDQLKTFKWFSNG